MREKPIVKKGEIVLCPSCKTPQLRITKDLYKGDAFNLSAVEGIGHVVEADDETVCYKGCMTTYFHAPKGALYTERGWLPYDPYDA